MTADQLKVQLQQAEQLHQQLDSKSSSSANLLLLYSCAKCRAPLFTSKQLIPHDPNADHKLFHKNKHSYSGKGNGCTSVFVNYEVVDWVKDESDQQRQKEEEEKKKKKQERKAKKEEVEGGNDGEDEYDNDDFDEDHKYSSYQQFSKKSEADDEKDLLCPNPRCKTKLGSKQWQGTQCSCGAWVTPAFKVLLSKVDGIPVEQQQQHSNTVVNGGGEFQ